MDFDNPKLNKIFQLGILVKDIDKAKKIYEEVFGIGPWDEPRVLSGERMGISVNGKPLNEDFFKVSFLHRYGFEIEMIQPIGDTPMKKWVDEHGSGLHHVDFRLGEGEDYEGFLEKCKEITGKDTWLRGLGFGGRMDFSYIDLTEELGMYVEVKPSRPGEDRPGYEY